jgi:hypothetical protein
MTSPRSLLCLAAALGLLAPGYSPAADAPKKPAPKKKAPAVKGPPQKREATPADALEVPAGFQVELLHTADPAAEGSWICLAKDAKGRLLIGGQRNHPLLRVAVADGKVAGESAVGSRPSAPSAPPPTAPVPPRRRPGTHIPADGAVGAAAGGRSRLPT